MHKEILEGDLGLRDAEAVRMQLLDALGEHAAVEVDSLGLTNLDISILQVLIAAGRSARERRKPFHIRARTGGPLATLLSRVGLRADSDAAPFGLQWD